MVIQPLSRSNHLQNCNGYRSDSKPHFLTQNHTPVSLKGHTRVQHRVHSSRTRPLVKVLTFTSHCFDTGLNVLYIRDYCCTRDLDPVVLSLGQNYCIIDLDPVVLSLGQNYCPVELDPVVLSLSLGQNYCTGDVV